MPPIRLAAAIALVLAAASPDAAAQDAASAAEIAELRAQLAALQARLAELEQRTAAPAQATQAATPVPQATPARDPAAPRTSLGGRMFFNLSDIDQTRNGAGTDASGTGLDVKRFYLTLGHRFDEVWSANLTTDFQYSAASGTSEVFVKKAYIEGKFDDAFRLRVGAADMPWVPLAEKYYGYRYVENVLVDRVKHGTSTDWGVHAAGDLAGARLGYALSLANGAGYKNPTRGKGMDVEARLSFAPVDGLVVAVGGYSGTLGKETETVDALHTARRGNAMVAWNRDGLRLGAEYFRSRDWGNVLSPVSDRASGYSAWGSYVFNAKGIAVFGRYDRADLSETLDPALRETYYNLGIEFPVTRGFKLATVFKNTDRDNGAAIDLETREIGVWGEASF